jgi:hypothetical protein
MGLVYGKTHYIPGSCNIGARERKKRYAFGVLGFIFAAVGWFLIQYFMLFFIYILVLFPLLLLGFEGLYQGYSSFCVLFASESKYDFSGSSNFKGRVKSETAHEKDIEKSTVINAASLELSFLVLIILFMVY